MSSKSRGRKMTSRLNRKMGRQQSKKSIHNLDNSGAGRFRRRKPGSDR